MATLTIRNLSQSLKERLRVRAAQRGHSMEAEARDILKVALGEAQRPPQRNLYERVSTPGLQRLAGLISNCHHASSSASHRNLLSD